MVPPKEKDFQGALPDLGMVTAVYHNHYSYYIHKLFGINGTQNNYHLEILNLIFAAENDRGFPNKKQPTAGKRRNLQQAAMNDVPSKRRLPVYIYTQKS